ncbi:cell wall-binding repeat-containing protein [Quadrisphaera sp. INWT6]|uniref:cell wall-binding repeat-containing protein n=1 Tax=Quadrisphaera sp. INWT6 TaxID=2596917 RepID=UPI001891F690|nr:cell wall-binding repeat-containing protein [Quadrisphaera sp. INWT6]MBF5081490.1 S8 family serine peptidase [Quadrisphaera sp. INWT6]
MTRRARRTATTAAAAALLALAVPAPALAAGGADGRAGQLTGPPAMYVVAVDDTADVSAVSAAADRLGDVVAVHPETGTVVVRATPGEARALDRLPGTDAVERDVWLTPAAVPWHLDRVDQASLPLDGRFSPGGDGTGVTAYVVDSGVRASHAAFSGRVRSGADFSGSGSTDDCKGHGTGVASALAGRAVGVATGATVVPLRVSGCSGGALSSTVIAAVEWAVRDHAAGAPAVLNLSMGGPPSSALDQSLRAAVADGITVVVAAGNETADACGVSPAREPQLITVGASTSDDGVASFSNRGGCVDLLAPGAGVVVASSASDTAAVVADGTSFSSPLVAGAAAVLLGANPALTPAQVAAALQGSASHVARPVSGTTDRLVRATAALPGAALATGGAAGSAGSSGSSGSVAGAALVVVGDQASVSDATAAALAGGRPAARVSGDDRYATSAAVSASAFPGGAEHVYLAVGATFPDALGAAAAAGAGSAPVLLVRPDGLPAPVAAELRRLAPAGVTVVGGPGAVSDAVIDQARAATAETGADVTRAAGADRYGTAAALALDALATSDDPSAAPAVVYLASGQVFADALSASSAAGRSGAPLLLTTAGALPDATTALLRTWRPSRVVVVGGTAVVTDAVLDQVRAATGGSVDRLAGATRYETAAAVLEAELGAGRTPSALWVASGEAFSDALVGAAAAAAGGGALVIVPPGGPTGRLADGVRAALPR